MAVVEIIFQWKVTEGQRMGLRENRPTLWSGVWDLSRAANWE